MESGSGWPLLSNVELVAKPILNSLALSDEDVINSGTDVLPLLRILLEIFQNSRDSSLLLSTLD